MPPIRQPLLHVALIHRLKVGLHLPDRLVQLPVAADPLSEHPHTQAHADRHRHRVEAEDRPVEPVIEVGDSPQAEQQHGEGEQIDEPDQGVSEGTTPALFTAVVAEVAEVDVVDLLDDGLGIAAFVVVGEVQPSKPADDLLVEVAGLVEAAPIGVGLDDHHVVGDPAQGHSLVVGVGDAVLPELGLDLPLLVLLLHEGRGYFLDFRPSAGQLQVEDALADCQLAHLGYLAHAVLLCLLDDELQVLHDKVFIVVILFPQTGRRQLRDLVLQQLQQFLFLVISLRLGLLFVSEGLVHFLLHIFELLLEMLGLGIAVPGLC